MLIGSALRRHDFHEIGAGSESGAVVHADLDRHGVPPLGSVLQRVRPPRESGARVRRVRHALKRPLLPQEDINLVDPQNAGRANVLYPEKDIEVAVCIRVLPDFGAVKLRRRVDNAHLCSNPRARLLRGPYQGVAAAAYNRIDRVHKHGCRDDRRNGQKCAGDDLVDGSSPWVTFPIYLYLPRPETRRWKASL